MNKGQFLCISGEESGRFLNPDTSVFSGPLMAPPFPWQCWAYEMLGRSSKLNLLKPTGYVIHQQFNIQQLYALPTLYLCVLYLSENKQRLVPLTA